MKRDPEITEILSTAGDLYSAYGAGCLARAVETYWHKRGFMNVRAERYEVPGTVGTWGVRSNLVGGMPPGFVGMFKGIDAGPGVSGVIMDPRKPVVPAALGVYAL